MFTWLASVAVMTLPIIPALLWGGLLGVLTNRFQIGVRGDRQRQTDVFGSSDDGASSADRVGGNSRVSCDRAPDTGCSNPRPGCGGGCAGKSADREAT